LSCSQEAIFRVVASILHIGNIEFTKGKDVDSSVPKDDKAKFHLKTTAELLMYGHCCIITCVFMVYSFFKMTVNIGSGVMPMPWKMHYVSVS